MQGRGKFNILSCISLLAHNVRSRSCIVKPCFLIHQHDPEIILGIIAFMLHTCRLQDLCIELVLLLFLFIVILFLFFVIHADFKSWSSTWKESIL